MELLDKIDDEIRDIIIGFTNDENLTKMDQAKISRWIKYINLGD